MPDAEEIGSAVESYLSSQVQHDDAGQAVDRHTTVNTGNIDEPPSEPMRPSRANVGPDSVEFITDFYNASEDNEQPEDAEDDETD